MKTGENEIAHFYFLLFFRIEAFQPVTADSNDFFSPLFDPGGVCQRGRERPRRPGNEEVWHSFLFSPRK
jgi:hypothetical protein